MADARTALERLLQEAKQDAVRLRQEGRVRSIPIIGDLDQIGFDFREFTGEELVVCDVTAKDLDELTGAGRTSKPRSGASLLDRLLFRAIQGSKWFFVSESGQVVLNIHTGEEKNLPVREAKVLLPKAQDYARLFLTHEIVVVHGYRRGTAWRDAVRSYFGEYRCRLLGGHQGITLVTLP